LLPLEALAAYGTEVPKVRNVNLSFLTVVQVAGSRKSGAGMQKDCNFAHQIERIRTVGKFGELQLQERNREP
jgi:hypothetical protein